MGEVSEAISPKAEAEFKSTSTELRTETEHNNAAPLLCSTHFKSKEEDSAASSPTREALGSSTHIREDLSSLHRRPAIIIARSQWWTMLSETLRTSAAAPPSHEHQWTPRDDMMPKHSSYYQSDDLPSAHRPKPAARPPPSPSSARSPSPFLERAEDSGAARRPLEPVIPPGVAAEREEVERQRQWRSLRWNELHYHHKESLAKELEQRILLLLWITVLLVHLHLTVSHHPAHLAALRS